MLHSELSVDEYDRVSIDTAEIERDDLVFARRGNRKLPPIPGGIDRQVTVPGVGVASGAYSTRRAWPSRSGEEPGVGTRKLAARQAATHWRPGPQRFIGLLGNFPFHRIIVGQVDLLPSHARRRDTSIEHLRRGNSGASATAKGQSRVWDKTANHRRGAPPSAIAPERITRPCIQPRSPNTDSRFLPFS